MKTPTNGSKVSTKAVAAGILLVALVLAGIVSFYASSHPDGLTKVSEDQGFDTTATTHQTEEGPFAGYEASFLDEGRLSKGAAGVVGVVVVLGLAGGLSLALRRRTPDEQSTTRTDAGTTADTTA